MHWINFLHLYQPANTESYHIIEATEKSYKRILNALEKNPQIKFTINISGSLLLRWEDLGYQELYCRFKKLIKNGQIELVGTAAYHALLPLMPKYEIIKQIKEQEQIIAKYLGKNIKLKGFFLPEIAYSVEVAKIIKTLGYEWLIVDDFAWRGKENETRLDYNQVYEDTAGLKIVFRSRRWSNSFPPETVSRLESEGYAFPIITATDAEIYGLRHEDPTGEFEKILKNKNLRTENISSFIKKRKNIIKIKLIDCSWDSSEKEIKNGSPYALWFDRNNAIQVKMWRLADMAINAYYKHTNDSNLEWARWHLARGLASCAFWWASSRDFRKVFGPIAWSPDEIEKGLNELIRTIRTLNNVSNKEKIIAEKLLAEIRFSIWEKHWQQKK